MIKRDNLLQAYIEGSALWELSVGIRLSWGSVGYPLHTQVRGAMIAIPWSILDTM